MKNKIIALSVSFLLVIVIGYILIHYFNTNTNEMIKSAITWIFYTIIALTTLAVFTFVFPRLKHIF